MPKIYNREYLKNNQKFLRTIMTKSEVVLWKNLKGKQFLNLKFRRQFGIGNYIVDFYCPEIKLVIEVDGSTHYEEEVFEKDLKKDEYIQKFGINLFRINSEEIFNNLKEVLFRLENICNEIKSKTSPHPSLLRRG